MIDFLDPRETLAYALGIRLYVRDDGRLSQHGPGRVIEPHSGAKPTQLGAPRDRATNASGQADQAS